MEIGFHGGHSAETFLSTNKNIKLVSFDIGQHNCVNLGKSFIDKKYPGRHTLILGDSLSTIPTYSSSNNIYFDVILIDGGHFYNIAKGDLLNCKKLAHKNTTVLMDDTVNNPKWLHKHNEGPNKAWNEVKQNNIVHELGSEDYCDGRGMSWGKYNI